MIKIILVFCSLQYIFLIFITYIKYSGKIMISQLLHDSWQFQYNQDSKWKEAEVPGSIHLDLWNNNLIPDPFYSDNEETVRWVSKQDWDYRLLFSLDNDIIDKKNKILGKK